MIDFQNLTLADLAHFSTEQLSALLSEAYQQLSQVEQHSVEHVRLQAAIRTITQALLSRVHKPTPNTMPHFDC